ncbi:unnamed protein product [Lactuca saligna]|uniref:Uncharacterized protein n=1 Tax=Lactuca saligna TaxID=75948 RepID=A0AA36E7C0_LACSI|nr:unnamed protein product [Lactuca saligna]
MFIRHKVIDKADDASASDTYYTSINSSVFFPIGYGSTVSMHSHDVPVTNIGGRRRLSTSGTIPKHLYRNVRAGQVNKLVEIQGLEIYCKTFHGSTEDLYANNGEDSMSMVAASFQNDEHVHMFSPVDVSASLSPMDDEIVLEFDEIEKVSDIEDILSYRSAAEHELQEFLVDSAYVFGNGEANTPIDKLMDDDQTSGKPQEWLKWLSRCMLCGGGTDDSNQFSGVVSDEVIKVSVLTIKLGIGYALAKEFLKVGDNVLICSISRRDRPFLPLSSYEKSLHLGSREVIVMDRGKDEELDDVTLFAQPLLFHLNQMYGSTKDEGDIFLGKLQIASLLALFVSDHFGGSDRSTMVDKARKSVSGSNYNKPFVCTCSIGNNNNIMKSIKQNVNSADDTALLCEKSLQLIKARRNFVVAPIRTLQFGVCRQRYIPLNRINGDAHCSFPSFSTVYEDIKEGDSSSTTLIECNMGSVEAAAKVLNAKHFPVYVAGRDDGLKFPTCNEFVLNYPNITTLALKGFKLHDYKAHMLVKGLQKLKHIDLSTSYSFMGSSLKNLSANGGGDNLEVMILRDCMHLKEIEVEHFMADVLAGEFKHLKHLVTRIIGEEVH